jgi:hypothetical protein
MEWYIITIMLAAIIWMVSVFLWGKSENRNKLVGFILIGPWVLLEKSLNRDLTKREKYGWMLVILLMILAVLFL